MSDLNKELPDTVGELVALAYAAIEKAQSLADVTGESFSFEIEYGAGATYYPASYVADHDYLTRYYGLDASEGGWVASSQTC